LVRRWGTSPGRLTAPPPRTSTTRNTTPPRWQGEELREKQDFLQELLSIAEIQQEVMEPAGEASRSRCNHANLAMVPSWHQGHQTSSTNQGQADHSRSYHTSDKGSDITAARIQVTAASNPMNQLPSPASHEIRLGLTPSSQHKVTSHHGALRLPQPAIRHKALSRHAPMSARGWANALSSRRTMPTTALTNWQSPSSSRKNFLPARSALAHSSATCPSG
jgi:hypothetical protein